MSIDTVKSRPGGRSARIREVVLAATHAELLEGGYEALSRRSVALRAGVDPATVYRRWPTRSRLAADALLSIASEAVPIPDTGSVSADLTAFLDRLTTALGGPQLLRLIQALSAAGAEADGDLRDTLHAFWDERFTGAEIMFTRAVQRGELPDGLDSHTLLEQLIAPAYFRALVTGKPMDVAFTERCVATVMAAARAT